MNRLLHRMVEEGLSFNIINGRSIDLDRTNGTVNIIPKSSSSIWNMMKIEFPGVVTPDATAVLVVGHNDNADVLEYSPDVHLERLIDILKGDMTCGICFEDSAKVRGRCHHCSFLVCMSCVSKISRCPQCRAAC